MVFSAYNLCAKILFIAWYTTAFAKEFVEALKTEPDDTKVKTLFGKHIRELHQSCESELLKFAKTAKACGKYTSFGLSLQFKPNVLGQFPLNSISWLLQC